MDLKIIERMMMQNWVVHAHTECFLPFCYSPISASSDQDLVSCLWKIASPQVIVKYSCLFHTKIMGVWCLLLLLNRNILSHFVLS